MGPVDTMKTLQSGTTRADPLLRLGGHGEQLLSSVRHGRWNESRRTARTPPTGLSPGATRSSGTSTPTGGDRRRPAARHRRHDAVPTARPPDAPAGPAGMTRPGPPLIDVTSSRFLGLRHARDSLPAWADPHHRGARRAGGTAAGGAHLPARRAVAGRRCRAGGQVVVARPAWTCSASCPSLATWLRLTSSSYPITEWSALRAAGRGVTVRRYPHHRPGRWFSPAGGRLFTMADGWCPGCNQPAPLGVLRQRAVCAGGLLVVDDSLAFGVVGDGAGTPAVVRGRSRRAGLGGVDGEGVRCPARSTHRRPGCRRRAGARRRQPGAQQPACRRPISRRRRARWSSVVAGGGLRRPGTA